MAGRLTVSNEHFVRTWCKVARNNSTLKFISAELGISGPAVHQRRLNLENKGVKLPVLYGSILRPSLPVDVDKLNAIIAEEMKK